MRKIQKQQAEDLIDLLAQAHDEIRSALEQQNIIKAQELLVDCQSAAISLGTLIEQAEGEGFATVALLEDYCELTYQFHESISRQETVNVNSVYKCLRKALFRIENSVHNDIKVTYEIVFLPYKASMWDSLESIWMAADEDPECNAYVVPIPYYDKKSNGAFGECHYDGNDFPEYVPITDYRTFSLEMRHPDVIYIHNPYDRGNSVTSIDPRFYSKELKKYTDCLMYVPYYATTGGMSEGQRQCLAYYYSDYIVIQAEKYRKFFDSKLPDRKFLPLGSPKFDRVIRMCQQNQECPKDWKQMLDGKKVYFYNTSIGGMLGDTESFLKKMEYVFHCFEGRKDICLLWRPHPLLESTFDSLRKDYRPAYDALKRYFHEKQIGIYDDTPDITKTIALCDAYVGDAGTSVTSLFGIAGKPLFILNNQIHKKPEKDDWRGEIIKGFFTEGWDEWMITQGNKLYYSPKHDYHYEYYCDLSKYAAGDYYLRAMEIQGRVYVCPANAQNILMIEEGRITKQINLDRRIERRGAFAGAVNIGEYIYLLPNQYPAIVRYHILNDCVEYIEDYNDIFATEVDGVRRIGGSCVWNGYLFLASPVENHVLAIDETGQVQQLMFETKDFCGCLAMIANNDKIWMLPYSGTSVVCWNPLTGETREYSEVPEKFVCHYMLHRHECMERPFGSIAFYRKYAVLSPLWGNMFLRLDTETGKMMEWTPPFLSLSKPKNGYYHAWSQGYFVRRLELSEEAVYRYYSQYDRKLYDVNLVTGEFQEISIVFDEEELTKHEAGFCENSEWLQYACEENYFNTLPRFLDGEMCGNAFSSDRQLKAYQSIAANCDGTCGKKVHEFAKREQDVRCGEK